MLGTLNSDKETLHRREPFRNDVVDSHSQDDFTIREIRETESSHVSKIIKTALITKHVLSRRLYIYFITSKATLCYILLIATILHFGFRTASFATAIVIATTVLSVHFLVGSLWIIRQKNNRYPDMNDPYLYYATKEGNSFWIIEQKGKIIGTGAVLKKSPSCGEVNHMFVDSACRGRGFGRRLLETAINYCREYGYSTVALSSDETRFEARALYKKYGFKKVSEKHFGFMLPFVYLRSDLFELPLAQTE
ncbi:N-acetyltransferase 8 [Lingula anatina]|uniref:N-acetyltransferase 8 n=1 Tax=Lingula anatina TaxID=7574 RepID=A0A1S3JNB2_LINAN|nr:N-acetyltransferase 8 [Lingula anatina]|eukprot:XP_013411863.1 N-acetyltransferase 8 [Lingula anatina]